MERGPVVRGLLNLLPATFRRRREPLRREGQERGCLRIGLGPVAGVGELARDSGERVDQSEDREAAPLPGDLHPDVDRDFASFLVMPLLLRISNPSSASSPSFCPIAFLITLTKPSRRASRLSTRPSTSRRISRSEFPAHRDWPCVCG